MSPNLTSRNILPIFTSYFWPAILALFMALILSQWAVADPPTEAEPQSESMTDEAPPAPDVEAIELPAPEENSADTEGTPDIDPLKTTPAVNKSPMSEIKLSDKCYEQTDGSFECVCEGEEECKTLETAEHCQPGTHWGKDGYGGCTKVADK